MLINANNITGQYLSKPLFKNVSFVINEQDKIGIIGANGVGKSTLLKMITGDLPCYEGSISRKKDLKIGYLPQESEFNKTDTILQTVLKHDPSITDFSAKTILSKMGINDTDRLIENLSGGELKRIGLSIALLTPVDLLILDEPTNHLDIWMINYLEKFLIKYNRAILMVTHDRYFLERVTKKILEIDKSGLTFYDAKYSGYLTLKAERLQSLQARERKLSAIYKKEAAWASLNPQARSTKSRERLDRFKNLEDELKLAKDVLVDDQNFALGSIKSRLGKKTIIIEDAKVSVNDKILFQNFSYNVNRFDRVGIVGYNGCGKTSLFKTILGQLPLDSGTIAIGETVKIGYFRQVGLDNVSNYKIIDYIKSFGEFIDTPNGRISASLLLETYLFSPSQQQMTISTLSGGEKRRLQLISVLISNPNILLLDEPTNDLDIYTLEILEDFLETFNGAVLVVSHDRYFLDKVCTHLLTFNNTQINDYFGLISDYLTVENLTKEETIKKEKAKDISNIPRFTSKEKKEYDNIEKNIEMAENLIEKYKQEQLTLSTDYEKILELDKLIKEQEELLDHYLERWEYLEDINKKIIAYRNSKY